MLGGRDRTELGLKLAPRTHYSKRSQAESCKLLIVLHRIEQRGLFGGWRGSDRYSVTHPQEIVRIGPRDSRQKTPSIYYYHRAVLIVSCLTRFFCSQSIPSILGGQTRSDMPLRRCKEPNLKSCLKVESESL